MKARKWTSQKKLHIVMDGIQNKRSISEICIEHSISQSMYYKWREQFLRQAHTVFDASTDKQIERLESKVKSLTGMVGELTIELKKTECELAWLDS